MKWIEGKPIEIGGFPLRVCKAVVDDGHLTVFVGQEPVGLDGKMRWHLSMSHRSNQVNNEFGAPAEGRMPTWEEIKEARYTFCPDGAYMAQILPPKAEYVNVHQTTIHLHEVGRDE